MSLFSRNINVYLKFLPFLVLYISICVIRGDIEFHGDEKRYWWYAENLLQGYYAEDNDPHGNEYMYLWSGPGYPLFLAFFMLMKLPLIGFKFLNAFLIYFGLVFFFKTARLFLSKVKAFISTVLLGFYYPLILNSIHNIHTESLCFFLISSFLYYYILYQKNKKKKNLVLVSFLLGFLILTKVFFAYVVLVLIILYLILYPFVKYKKEIRLLMLSIAFTIPYQIYTYNKTGELFYFANSGGMSLYWMSSPYEKEFGDWHWFPTLKEKQEIYNNHKVYLNSINHLDYVSKDKALKKKAIKNILNNKKKFVNNWISNIGRLFFAFPFTGQVHSNFLFYFLPINGVLIVLGGISFLLVMIKLKNIDRNSIFIILFTGVYIFGILLLSCYPRFLYPLIPMIYFFISVTLNKYVVLLPEKK